MTFGRRSRTLVVLAGVAMAGLAACANGDATPAAGGSTQADTGQVAGQVTGTVWVADEDGDSLTAIDASSSRAVTTVNGIASPHNVQASPDGATVWAVSGSAQAVVAIDAVTHELLGSGPTGAGPAHVVVSPDGDRAYVTNSADDSLSVYESAGARPAATIPLSAGPHGLRPTADGATLVVANTAAGSIDLVDTRSRTRTVSIPVGASPVQVAVDAQARYAYVSLAGDRAVAQVDLRRRAVTRTVAVPSAPVQLYLTPDGTRLLSANQGSQDEPGRTVSMIEVPTMTVTDTITTGSGPHGVVIDTSGRRAWVTNTFDDTVSVLDLNSNAVVATVPVGDRPNGITFTTRTTPPAHQAMSVDVPNYAGEMAEPGGHEGDSNGQQEGHDH